MKFSIIMAIYNCENYLSQSIESVINQDIGFRENVQLILVDDGSSDNSKKIALNYQKKYPKNILVLTKENGGPGSARNFGLNHANGEYINFLDSDDKLSLNTLSCVCSFFERNDVDIVSIPLVFFERRDGEHVLNYKFATTRIIDLDELFDYPQLHISSSFIKSNAIKNLKFNDKLVNGEDALFLNKILLNKHRYGVLSNATYWYRKRNDFSSIMDKSKNSTNFFLEKIINFYLELIKFSLNKEKNVPKFIQYLIAYDLNAMVESKNFKPDNDFLKYFNQVLLYIDEEIIINHRYLNHNVKSFLIYLKNNDFHVEINNNQVFLKSNDYIINKLNKHKLRFEKIEFKDNILYFKGYFSSNCDINDIKINAIKNNHEYYNADFISSKPFKKFFDIDWEYYYTFEVIIPISKKEECNIAFNVNIFDITMNNKIKFKKDAKSFNSHKYLIINDKIIQFKNNRFYIYNNSLKNKILFNLSSNS